MENWHDFKKIKLGDLKKTLNNFSDNLEIGVEFSNTEIMGYKDIRDAYLVKLNLVPVSLTYHENPLDEYHEDSLKKLYFDLTQL